MASPQALAKALARQQKALQVMTPTRQITDFEKYKDLTSSNPNIQVEFKPLNFDKLKEVGAVRVTHRGMDDGFDPNPMGGFSLVSGYNDAVGEQTRNWKDNPAMYDVVKDMFTTRPQDIGAHKYAQIVQSAKDLGLSDEEIYNMVRK